PPEWMRELVIVRDRHCVFPWCRTDARCCDLDHIEPYQAPDHGGPPGQTTPTNLAPLCRRHHNAKTTGRWRYQRHPDGTYTWHGPTTPATSSRPSAPPHSHTPERVAPHSASSVPRGPRSRFRSCWVRP